MKKLVCLIVYINNAHGFRGPAEAVAKALTGRGDTEVHCVDLLDYLGTRRSDRIWKRAGARDMDSPVRNFITYHIAAKLIWIAHELQYQVVRRKLHAYVREINPDLIISTHFGTNGIIGRYLHRSRQHIPFFAYNAEVISFHSSYVSRYITDYVAPTPDGAEAIREFGVGPERIFESAYPLDEKFLKSFSSVAQERERLGLADMFTILLSFGGEGIGSYDILENIITEQLPVQVVVLCGRNEEAYANVQKLAERAGPARIVPFGFVSNMQDYLYCCDISAGKAGMNTTFESIYMRRPFMVTKALINEQVNVELIRRYDLGWQPEHAAEVVSIVRSCLEDPSLLAAYEHRFSAVPYELSSEKLAADILRRYHVRKRLDQIDTICFDLAGTLCDIPIGGIWDRVNTDGFLQVLDFIGYTPVAGREETQSLTERFLARKRKLRRAAKETLREYPLEIQLKEFLLDEMEDDRLLRERLELFDLEDAQILEQLDRLYMRPELEITTPFHDLRPVLKRLSRSYKLYLLSNNASTQLVMEIVRTFGIEQYFADIFISSTLGWRKPHPGFIAPVLEKMAVDPSRIVMVGDRLGQDIKMADDTGMLSVFISTHPHEDNDGLSVPYDLEVKSLRELARLLTDRRPV